MTPELKRALIQLGNAVEFFDKVKASSPDERIAVGTDHHAWLEKAAREVVQHSGDITREPAHYCVCCGMPPHNCLRSHDS